MNFNNEYEDWLARNRFLSLFSMLLMPYISLSVGYIDS